MLKAIGFLLITIVAAAPIVQAQDSWSENFITRDAVTSDLGGTSSSTNFSTVENAGEIAHTEATSTNFILNGGPLYFESQTLKSQNWRWYDDEENETPATALADENVAPTNLLNGNAIKLRLAIAEVEGIGLDGTKLRLQFSTTSDFSEQVGFVVEINDCTASSLWCYADGGGTDGAVISSKVLSDADACSGGVGNGCGTHNESGTSTSSFLQPASATTEYEFTISQSGALANTVYFFRALDVAASSSIPLNTGESYPSLATGGMTLTFSIEGLEVGTTTEGITTDVETTSTSIPFGTLLSATPVEAAQRLTVSTSASQGYKIYTFQRQGLLGSNGEILPVSGTNASPLGWTTGCDSGAAGCYGYHSGEDVLEGGSTRFSANDTYAQFSEVAHEIAYSSGPANDRTTDVVYKVEARNLQESGSYSSSIVYIVAPVL